MNEVLSEWLNNAGWLLSGALAHPLIRVGGKIYAAIGHTAAIITLARTYPRVTKSITVCAAVVGAIGFLSGCTPTYALKDVHSPTQRVEIRGPYALPKDCVALKSEYRQATANLWSCQTNSWGLVILNYVKPECVDLNETSKAVKQQYVACLIENSDKLGAYNSQPLSP